MAWPAAHPREQRRRHGDPRAADHDPGWELHFATNHLGHFALANGLHEALATANGARFVSLGSSAQPLGTVVFDDLHFRFRAYDPLERRPADFMGVAPNAIDANNAHRFWETANRLIGAQG